MSTPQGQTKPHERISKAKAKAAAGPVLLQNSFRPFFLAAGVWATLTVPFWLLTYAGILQLPAAFDTFLWHRHEMLFGFAAAAIAGFILTAIPNWTGRLPVSGARLGGLVALWLAGRLAVLAAVWLDPIVVAVVDLSFLTALAAMIARELITGKNWRNLPVLVLITLFAAGNWLVHAQILGLAETAALGIRLAIFTLATLLALIGGRIVPSFTRNWLVRRGVQGPPAPMGTFDKIALAALVLFVVGQVFAPEARTTAFLALLAGVLHGLRLLRWRGWMVLSEPLLWILHLGYGWLAVGFIMTGLAGLTDLVPPTAAIHALTVGGFGTMILAVMTRATLGHSGRALKATPAMTMIFASITIAALARVAEPFLEGSFDYAIWLSAIAWTVAYGIFTVLFFPIFTRRRPGGQTSG